MKILMIQITSDYLPILIIVPLSFTAGCKSGEKGVNHKTSGKTQSEWVHYGNDEKKLVYKTTKAGDRIMDFSYAGYMGGGVALPTSISVKQTIKPSAGDDTDIIQMAIDKVSAMPLKNGFRGVVLLAPGTFTTSETIRISASGVVLRGSGSGTGEESKTIIKMIGKPHLAFSIRRSRDQVRTEREEFVPAKTLIADAYVPSGVLKFKVADATGFTVGNTIFIRKPVTEAWVRFMAMDDLVRDGRPQTWLEAGSTIDTNRRVAAISGNTITLDVPLSDSYDSEYLNPPGTVVVKIQPPARISQVGIEHLNIVAPPQAISHTQSHFSALRMYGKDLWAQDLVIEETMNSVGIGGRRITLEQVHIYRKARSQGASRPAAFAPNGSQVLLDRCSVDADNIWFVATGSRVSGPIVILNSDFRGDSRAESHQRWSTGMLYDNVHAPQGRIELRNRGSMGSGHGWSMGWGVVWNSIAKGYIVQYPPGAPNWMIGNVGEIHSSPRPFGSGPDLPNGIIDLHGTPVMPKSLYLAQLAERLGPQALRNIGY